MRVIDISKHQNTFAASTAKAAGAEGVILRHAYGTTPDTKATGWAPDVTTEEVEHRIDMALSATCKEV